MTDLRQAAQQALEALENSSPDQYPEDAGVFYDAITALKAALEQQAEPVADEAIHAAWSAGYVEGEKAALQQQAEPPPEWLLIKNILDEYGLDAIAFVAEWKAAQQKAEPVAWMDKHGNIDHGLDAILEPEGWKPLYTIPLYTTPPQQQAEPTCPDCKAAVLYECVACSSNNYPPKQQAEPVAKLFGSLPVYDTAPPQRKELPASEILNMMPSGIPAEYDGELMEFARAVEAKLKERNT